MVRAIPLRQFVSLCLLFCVFSFSFIAQAEQLSVLPRIVQPVDETKLTVLKGNTHPLARPQYDQGIAPPDLPMDRMLLLLKRSPEQDSALRSLLDQQQDKGSPNYHKWLTPEQFGKQFGPADQDIQTVTNWLQSHGFRIGNVAKGRNMIEFSGTATQVQEALHTSIHKYVVNGEEHWANAGDPKIPTALTPVVAGVYTLHNFLKKPLLRFSGEKIAAKLEGNPPHVTFNTDPPTYALGPEDYEVIYNIGPSGMDGSGTSIAIVARSNVFEQGRDVTNFDSVLGYWTEYYEVVLNGPDPGDLGGGEEAEATLDLTWSGVAAPSAILKLVVSASTNTSDGVDLSELYIIDNNLADIMTESFGACELSYSSTEAQGIADLAEQAAAQGITYTVASGDSGAEGCDNPNTETVAHHPPSVNILAATPYTVAVGGTEFNENGQDDKYWSLRNSPGDFESALSYIPENVWNESCTQAQCGSSANIAAGGGGASIYFSKPAWQSGVQGIPNDGMRDLPDVSLTASSHDAYLLCLEGSCVPDQYGNFFVFLIAGTSASTPSFAGVMSLVDQKMHARQGQAGYVLYGLAAAETLSKCNASNTSSLPGASCVFNDVTVGNNAVPGAPNYGKPSAQYQSGVGYDLATGLGSVNVTNLVNKWHTISFTPTTTTIVSLSPTTITHGQAVNAEITVTASSGTPTGDVSLVTSTGQEVGFFPLSGGSFSGPVPALPGGTYTLIAHYAGDGTFRASDSLPSASVTVTGEPSSTSLSVLGYPNQNGVFPPFTNGSYGTFVYLRADVKGQSGVGNASGHVNFMDGAASVPGDPYVLNSQGNTVTPNGVFTFAAGSHSIVADYVGDPSFNASSSSSASFTITQASSTTSVTAEGTRLGATVNTSSGGAPPSGTVTFFVDGAQAGDPVPLSGHGARIDPQSDLVITGASATANLTVANPPSKSFKAVYSGDGNYRGSVSPSTRDFILATSATKIVVPAPGLSGSMDLIVTAVDGFTGTMRFDSSSCSGLPTAASCNFNPNLLTGSGRVRLSITTVAPYAAMLKPGNQRDVWWWAMATGPGWAGLLLLGFPIKRRKRLLSVMTCALLITIVSCGGGTTNSPPPPAPSTPPGNSDITVKAVSGSLTHTVRFFLVVK